METKIIVYALYIILGYFDGYFAVKSNMYRTSIWFWIPGSGYFSIIKKLYIWIKNI